MAMGNKGGKGVLTLRRQPLTINHQPSTIATAKKLSHTLHGQAVSALE
jgi:hypothetical protein